MTATPGRKVQAERAIELLVKGSAREYLLERDTPEFKEARETWLRCGESPLATSRVHWTRLPLWAAAAALTLVAGVLGLWFFQSFRAELAPLFLEPPSIVNSEATRGDTSEAFKTNDSVQIIVRPSREAFAALLWVKDREVSSQPSSVWRAIPALLSSYLPSDNVTVPLSSPGNISFIVLLAVASSDALTVGELEERLEAELGRGESLEASVGACLRGSRVQARLVSLDVDTEFAPGTPTPDADASGAQRFR